MVSFLPSRAMLFMAPSRSHLKNQFSRRDTGAQRSSSSERKNQHCHAAAILREGTGPQHPVGGEKLDPAHKAQGDKYFLHEKETWQVILHGGVYPREGGGASA
jgi:hypothetical protein